jgi:Fic family protein
MPDPIANPEIRDRYYIASLIEEAITSSQLEGASTTRQVAKEMIRSGRKPRDRSEQMIFNNYLTMKAMGEFKSERLTPGLVFRIHRLVTENTLDDPSAAGRFRRKEEPITVSDPYGTILHHPPPADELEERLAAMCDFANGKTPDGFLHPALRSIILHFWLAYDHPFVDGNGRTARALFYWSMLHHGYWLCEYISISHILRKAPAQYGRAFLYTETDDNDLTYFVLYHLEVIDRAIRALHEYIRRKTEDLKALDAKLKGFAVFNHRQRALLSHALRHPGYQYTVQGHQASHNVVYETARSDLMALQEQGLLQARKIGRRWYFAVVKDLEKKLADLA